MIGPQQVTGEGRPHADAAMPAQPVEQTEPITPPEAQQEATTPEDVAVPWEQLGPQFTQLQEEIARQGNRIDQLVAALTAAGLRIPEEGEPEISIGAADTVQPETETEPQATPEAQPEEPSPEQTEAEDDAAEKLDEALGEAATEAAAQEDEARRGVIGRLYDRLNAFLDRILRRPLELDERMRPEGDIDRGGVIPRALRTLAHLGILGTAVGIDILDVKVTHPIAEKVSKWLGPRFENNPAFRALILANMPRVRPGEQEDLRQLTAEELIDRFVRGSLEVVSGRITKGMANFAAEKIGLVPEGEKYVRKTETRISDAVDLLVALEFIDPRVASFISPAALAAIRHTAQEPIVVGAGVQRAADFVEDNLDKAIAWLKGEEIEKEEPAATPAAPAAAAA